MKPSQVTVWLRNGDNAFIALQFVIMPPLLALIVIGFF
ncbi:hypothetical protein ABIE28_001692 [Devosia sp. 2618]